MLGVDVSTKALKLASYNMRRAYKSGTLLGKEHMHLLKADVLMNPFADRDDNDTLPFKIAMNYRALPTFWDIVISNPPYISPWDYWKTTTRSVRGYEPRIALVPPSEDGQSNTEQGDLFYQRLFKIARDVEAKIVLLEVADLDQAQRVAQRAVDLDIFDGVEIWRESPNAITDPSSESSKFPVVGQGNGRSVLCWRGAGTSWLGKGSAATAREDAQRLFVSHAQSTFNEVPHSSTVPTGQEFDWTAPPKLSNDTDSVESLEKYMLRRQFRSHGIFRNSDIKKSKWYVNYSISASLSLTINAWLISWSRYRGRGHGNTGGPDGAFAQEENISKK